MNKLTRMLRTALDVFDLYDGASTAARDRVGDFADRARKFFRSQRSYPGRKIGNFAVGTGLGLGVSLLLAPARGAETRREIVRRAERIGGTVRERFSFGAKKPFARARASKTGGVREAAK